MIRRCQAMMSVQDRSLMLQCVLLEGHDGLHRASLEGRPEYFA